MREEQVVQDERFVETDENLLRVYVEGERQILSFLICRIGRKRQKELPKAPKSAFKKGIKKPF